MLGSCDGSNHLEIVKSKINLVSFSFVLTNQDLLNLTNYSTVAKEETTIL